ncbi:MAG TPA: hypothetical protein VJT49_18220 [Amycolatopsis sp.]|uniref:hypothetical protein n=1 Tax=Amycolatopsis sp. TaxID=37632 RepID=UPI002B46BAB8|nr:hypothetical protein [Amycolatopsis sp.]HKS47006.1 hypothetical protein [Amycolatopsis sp.]
MKIVFLAKWRPETDSAAIENLLEVAEKSLASGPFADYQHGLGLHLAQGGASVADWGFILDLEPDDLERWKTSEAHEALGRALRPICGEGMTIEF